MQTAEYKDNIAKYSKFQVIRTISETGIVPVFYNADPEIGKQVLKACYEGGIRAFEFTNRGDFAHEVFGELVKYANAELPGMILSVGSVVDPATASLYLQLGANFVVGPLFNPEIAPVCNRRLVPYCPGCGSVTEIGMAQDAGCDLCKVFPGDVLGPKFVMAVLAPMPWTRIMVTGGVKPEFHWTDANYGTITSFFSIFYAIVCLFAGKFVDWMGTRKGYLIAIGVWSAGACLHAACGWATGLITGTDVAAIKGMELASNVALAISTTSVYLFLLCRGILALGESGNFPAAIKVTAEYFPKKDRAFATSIFNAGASVGALAAPLCIPPLALKFGWEAAFIIIGALGFIWMFFWVFMYDKPENSKHVNEAELEYIHQDDAAEAAEKAAIAAQKSIPFGQCFKYRQTWAFITGKFFTDGV